MDESGPILSLDARSLSGIAIPFSFSSPSCPEKAVFLPTPNTQLKVSQTLKGHTFPFFLEIIISDSNTREGVMLLLPIDLILSLVISDHAEFGHNLRFKLASGVKTPGIIRQTLRKGLPGRLYGLNEDDPYDLLGMLRFGELNVRAFGQVLDWADRLLSNVGNEGRKALPVYVEDTEGSWRVMDSRWSHEAALEEEKTGDCEGEGPSTSSISDDDGQGQDTTSDPADDVQQEICGAGDPKQNPNPVDNGRNRTIESRETRTSENSRGSFEALGQAKEDPHRPGHYREDSVYTWSPSSPDDGPPPRFKEFPGHENPIYQRSSLRPSSTGYPAAGNRLHWMPCSSRSTYNRPPRHPRRHPSKKFRPQQPTMGPESLPFQRPWIPEFRPRPRPEFTRGSPSFSFRAPRPGNKGNHYQKRQWQS
jgi:hypothetical protein